MNEFQNASSEKIPLLKIDENITSTPPVSKRITERVSDVPYALSYELNNRTPSNGSRSYFKSMTDTKSIDKSFRYMGSDLGVFKDLTKKYCAARESEGSLQFVKKPKIFRTKGGKSRRNKRKSSKRRKSVRRSKSFFF